jgi:ribonuclease VapC
MSETYVLDSSAVLCLIAGEPGAETVAECLRNATISSVNYAEVVSKLIERGADEGETNLQLMGLELTVIDHTKERAFQTGALRAVTKSAGLSLGDRDCLALAREQKAIAVTTDKAWTKVNVGVEIRFVR